MWRVEDRLSNIFAGLSKEDIYYYNNIVLSNQIHFIVKAK